MDTVTIRPLTEAELKAAGGGGLLLPAVQKVREAAAVVLLLPAVQKAQDFH